MQQSCPDLSGPPPEGPASAAYARCAAGTTVRAACVGIVDDLYERWDLPSTYLLIDGRLRCQASRGYFQVSDGFTTSTGVIGRVVSSGCGEVVQDADADPTFIAAIPGLQAEACMPVRVFGEVVGAVNLEARGRIEPAAVADLERAAAFLGSRLEALGGLPEPSLAERLARITVELGGQSDVAGVQQRALAGALELSGMSSAALAHAEVDGWAVTTATGPLEELIRSWDVGILELLAGWVRAKTSSHFPPGEQVPDRYEFLTEQISALSVQPLVAAGRVAGMLITADSRPAPHDPTLNLVMELLATQTAAMLAVTATVEALAEEAAHDPLTGLLNRRQLLERLQRATGTDGAALVLLDLDGFKAVNDSLGHARGDAVLCSVAAQLTAAARADDQVFRLGGDEFAVLVTGLASADDAAAVGARFTAAAATNPDPAEQSLVGASAGVRLLCGEPASGVLVDADAALYAAKRTGPGRAVLWEPALRQAQLERDALLTDLRRALRDGALSLAYQPVVEIRSLRVRGLEALARWQHPTHGQVRPALFVQSAEDAGLARELTAWTLRIAFRDAATWPAGTDGDHIKVAVNLSPIQLADEHIVTDVRVALADAGLPADRVVLEVTETAPVLDLALARRTLEALAELGVSLALDDFGTGYSSLTHAQALPFDILKIDHSFVAAATAGSAPGTATVAAICALGRGLGVDVVAEGIEDLGQLTALRELGCDYAQGNRLAPPLDAATVAAALSTATAPGWALPLGGTTSEPEPD